MSLLGFDQHGYGFQLLRGAWITIQLAASGLFLSFLLGTLIALATLRQGGVRWIAWKVYASIIMGVPSLLVIFLLYYGGSSIAESLFAPFGLQVSLDMTPFGAGVAALSIVYSAYVAEVVRGAAWNVPKGQFEAAAALSLAYRHVWIYVILPQVIRLALPGLVNLWIILLKDTALVSLVGLHDLVGRAKIAAGSTKQPFVFFTAAAMFFVFFNAATIRVSRYLEERLQRGMRPAEA